MGREVNHSRAEMDPSALIHVGIVGGDDRVRSPARAATTEVRATDVPPVAGPTRDSPDAGGAENEVDEFLDQMIGGHASGRRRAAAGGPELTEAGAGRGDPGFGPRTCGLAQGSAARER